MRIRIGLAALAAVCGWAQGSAPAIPVAVKQAEGTIDAERIRAHARFLADDLLEGVDRGCAAGSWRRSILRRGLRWTDCCRAARFGMELGWEALSAAQRVEWKAGDEFEAVRKNSAGR